MKDFDSQNWRPYHDMRTNAELIAAWEALGRDERALRDWDYAKDVMYRQHLIEFQLQMRKWHHIGDDWVHPKRQK